MWWTERRTCDLDVHGGLVVPCNVFGLHCNLVNPRVLVAVLDGLVSHRQVLVNGSDSVTQVYLVLGAACVALLGSTKTRLKTKPRRKDQAGKKKLLLPALDGQ